MRLGRQQEEFVSLLECRSKRVLGEGALEGYYTTPRAMLERKKREGGERRKENANASLLEGKAALVELSCATLVYKINVTYRSNDRVPSTRSGVPSLF
jgi:hypothetical protein